ncbi:hypothetical protein Sbal625DRAFT_1716 [Shewanella baltica OS625]|uniref:Uncharacterized protein n=1 Tax=Shewanella baltica (strain OS195) TaxID=399599 RepID=A9KWF9_SHEB9|nr:hypothetical protein [Shewanella baltica]ABX48782.1 conserved hypothetical protein [Shewanella baltica OS195]ADT93820.1 hypothetical protein Sbal678_1648 [Shewanella baltica OS678]EHC07046.1 hypothetical protein Sbal625DRAFT_1716 [Shewanella baltica OS625]
MRIYSPLCESKWLSSLPALLGLSLLPLPALAFDPSGGTASLFIILGLGGFTLINLFLQGLFFFAGQYRSAAFAKRHVLSALIVPLIAVALAIYDHRGWSDFALNLGIICVAIGLILLPLQLCQIDKPSNRNADWIISLGALFILALSYVIAPLAFFTLVLAHICLASSPSRVPKLLSYISLLFGYGLFGYWLYQTAMMFQS